MCGINFSLQLLLTPITVEEYPVIFSSPAPWGRPRSVTGWGPLSAFSTTVEVHDSNWAPSVISIWKIFRSLVFVILHFIQSIWLWLKVKSSQLTRSILCTVMILTLQLYATYHACNFEFKRHGVFQIQDDFTHISFHPVKIWKISNFISTGNITKICQKDKG